MSLPGGVIGENTLRTAQDVHAVLTLQTQVVPAILALQKQVTDVGTLDIREEILNLTFGAPAGAEVLRSTLSKISKKIIDLAFDGVNAYVQQSVQRRVYDICDAGQYLDGQSRCLNKYPGVSQTANRCFYLAVMSALQDAEHRANRDIHNLTYEQASKIHALGTNPEETKSEALIKLNEIVRLPSCVVGVWHVDDELDITFTETLSYVSSQDREVLTLHILNIQNKHFVALIPIGTDKSNSACTGCDEDKTRVGLRQGRCRTGKKCCNKARPNQKRYLINTQTQVRNPNSKPIYVPAVISLVGDSSETESEYTHSDGSSYDDLGQFAQTQGYETPP